MKDYRIRIVDEAHLLSDTETLNNYIDDLSAAAMSIHSGGQHAYAQFIQLRQEFKDLILNLKNQYNIVQAK
jgi:hypothetical protein